MIINIFFILMCLAMLGTVLVLIAGLGGFGKDNDWYRKNANKLMRWRIILQMVAIVFFFIYLWSIGA